MTNFNLTNIWLIMFLKVFSVNELDISKGYKNGLRKIQSSSNFEKSMLIMWLLGPFIYLIERSPADAWLTALAFIFLIRSYKKKEWNWIKQTWFKFATALWLTGLISALLSPDPYFTFSQGFVWIRFPLYAVAVQTWLARDRDIRIVMLISMCLGMIIMCLILTAELIFSPLDASGVVKTRLTWPYGDLVPGGYLAKVSLPLFCILIAVAVNKASKLSGYYGILALIPLGYLFLTGERTNTFLKACSGIMSALVWRPKFLALMILLIIQIFSVILLIFFKPDLGNRFTEKFYESLPMVSVNSGHWGTWRSGIQQGLETPIIGIGPSGTRKTCFNLPERSPKWLPGKNLCANHPHNFYAQLFAETGIIGLFFGTCMIISIIYACFKGRRINPSCPMLGTAFVVPFAIFFPIQQFGSFFGQWNNLFIWFAIAFALSNLQNSKKRIIK